MIDKKTREELRNQANNFIKLYEMLGKKSWVPSINEKNEFNLFKIVLELLDALEETLESNNAQITFIKERATSEGLLFIENHELKTKLKEAEKLNAKWSEDWSQLYDECFKAKTKLKSAEELIAKKDDKIKGTMEVKCYACDGDDKYDECTCLEIYDQRDKLLGEALALTLRDDPKLLVENTRSPIAKRTEGWITKDGE